MTEVVVDKDDWCKTIAARIKANKADICVPILVAEKVFNAYEERPIPDYLRGSMMGMP